MQDYQIKVIVPNSVTLNLHKKGVEMLENTADEYGTTMMTRLMRIVERMPGTVGTLNDIAAFSAEGAEIVAAYLAVYFPN